MSFRLISSEPKLAKTLEQINFGILPKDVRDWAIDWVRDVGVAVRSREMMVGYTVSLIYYAGLIVAISLLERFLGVKLFRLGVGI